MSEPNDQTIIRMQKLEKIKSLGVDAYPYSYDRSGSISDAVKEFESSEKTGRKQKLAGRIMAFRRQGKTAFGNIKDISGRIQIYVRKDSIGEEKYDLFKCFEIGDIIGVEGELFRTHTGEITVNVADFKILAKAVLPLPVPKEKIVNGKKEVYDEFRDIELRYRQRYLDLILNEKVMETFILRAKIIQSVRNFLIGKNFIEVETPTLQNIYGGASARPFETHHNALDMKLYLRISNELYLKRLITGGMEKVFEFVKDFRNEGIDRTHNPEFTQVEFYQAYADYNTMMELFEKIYSQAASEVLGKTKITYQGKEIDLTPPWKRMAFMDALSELGGINTQDCADDELKQLMKKHEIEFKGDFNRGLAFNALFEKLCEHKLIQPTFITDFPIETTPLCKPHRNKPALVERFEPYIAGWEVGNAYSELTDPILQRKLLEAQVERGRGGEEDTHPMDEDFVRSMEFGMPPTGGVGIGIDRMVMLLTDSYSIRDVILFPLMRP
ncbi:MAG: lysine--tRNA ligase [bacterium]